MSKHDSWFNEEVLITGKIVYKILESEEKKAMGHPASTFEEATDRIKRRKIKQMRGKHTVEELAFQRKLEAGKIINYVTIGSQRLASKYTASLGRVTGSRLLNDKILAILYQYQSVRSISEVIETSTFCEAKKKYYQSKYKLSFTKKCEKVRLQGLMNYTIERMLLHKLMRSRV